MKGCLIFFLSLAVFILCGIVAYLVLRQPEIREKLVLVAPEAESETELEPSPGLPASEEGNKAQLARLVEKISEALRQNTQTDSDPEVYQPTISETSLDKVYNQYLDADKAFAKDELFAVTSKRTIRRETYTDHFDKNSFGNARTKVHPAVYIVRAMGRETRENYLFIVPRRFYDRAMIYQKFTNAELSNFEYFLSETKMEREIFSRRIRGKLID